MRNRVPSLGCAVVCACALFAATATAGERDQSNARVIPDAKASAADRTAVAVKGTPLFSDTGEPMGTIYPMSRDVRGTGGVAGVLPDLDAACRADPGAAYCNALSPAWWQPSGDNPLIRVGDDVSLASIGGCDLDRYVVRVNGNADGLGDPGRPYTVTTSLYSTCRGATFADPIPGTSCTRVLPDSDPEFVTCVADPGTRLVTIDEITQNEKPVNNLWVGIQFNRLNCSIAVGAPATKGYSADALDFPGFACTATFGGFEPENSFDSFGTHASFYLELYTSGDCADPGSEQFTEAFPNYKGSNHQGLFYTPGGGIRFADDVSLETPQCFMTSLEVAIKGNGVVNIDLRTSLSDVDPVHGGVIPGTGFFVIGSDDVVIGRKDFDPPILLNQPDLWVGYHTTSAVTGPIVTAREAALGRNEDSMWVHSGTRWQAGPLADGRYAATDVIIHCADTAPLGACCDMVMTNNANCVGGGNHGAPCTGTAECPDGTCVGDSVCRDDLAAMNCANGNLVQLWRRNSVCEGVCVGGDLGDRCYGGQNDGLLCSEQVDCPDGCIGGSNPGDPCDTDDDCDGGECQRASCGALCTRQIDCPGFRCVGGVTPGAECGLDAPCNGGVCKRAECDGPFIRSCGLAACCTLTDECFDLIEKECFEVDPIEEPRSRMFQFGEICGLTGQRCPFGACLGRAGNCQLPHPEPGCEDPFCCTDVCTADPFCCLSIWDQFCVDLAIQECEDEPANDECSGRGEDGARMVRMGDNVIADIQNGTENFSDPGFCCHLDDPGAQGLGTVWFKFIGPEPPTTQEQFSSVRIHTCQANSSHSRDSLIQVFTMAEPDRGECTDGSACSVLAQDCEDELPCVTVVDDQTACRTLIPIGCSDDTEVGCGRPLNSSVCLQNVVPGWVYYVLVAAKSEEFRDTYRLDIIQNCTSDPPIPNDACSDSMLLEGGSPEPLVELFDLSGGEEFEPVTYDCLMPPCDLASMQNDLWYDWVAPCDAAVTIETCDSLLPASEQPNTTMIVYEGCGCPASCPREIAVSDFCGFTCGLSSCVTFEPVEGQCYKIRVGGHVGGRPEGKLTISLACPLCPIGPVTFMDPVDGTVDARQSYPPGDSSVLLGIDELLVSGPALAGMNNCWRLCETADTGTPNDISDVIDNGDGSFTVQLDRPLTPGEVTTIIYTGSDGVETRGTFVAHPANVDASGFSQGADVTAIINALGGGPVQFGLYSTDIDWSGTFTPADMLRVIDLLNGADMPRAWADTQIPECDGDACCPEVPDP